MFALRDSLTSFVVDDLWSVNAISPVVVEPLPEFFCYGGTVDIDRVLIQLNEYGKNISRFDFPDWEYSFVGGAACCAVRGFKGQGTCKD